MHVVLAIKKFTDMLLLLLQIAVAKTAEIASANGKKRAGAV